MDYAQYQSAIQFHVSEQILFKSHCNVCFIVFCGVKLSKNGYMHLENIAPIIYFAPLILAGYMSVGTTVYTLITGTPYIGNRTDIISK